MRGERPLILAAILFICASAAQARQAASTPTSPAPGQPASQAGSQPSMPTPQQAEEAFARLPWAVRLGLRSLRVDQVIPLLDRVVLVPDVATYIDELSKWSLRGRWPVLIEDQVYTPMFVRRFAPAQIIRREAVKTALPEAIDQRQAKLEAIVAHAFGGEEGNSITGAFAMQKFVPAGVVIASVNDPAWTAAVALAAGHGQPLLWMNDNWGVINDTLNDANSHALAKSVDDLVAGCGYRSETMGDEIDTVTICRNLPGKADVRLAPAAQIDAGGAQNNGPIATTDYLCRHRDGSRYAYVGLIWGDEKCSAYVAMCSLFLPRENAWLFNGHPLTGGWEMYGLDEAATRLQEKGYHTRLNKGDDATLKSWVRILPGGVSTDLFMLNSKGNVDFFDLYTGTASPYDTPVLNQPVALHLIHSWAMQSPSERASVGGRWLAHGVYAAVGSCWEPLLGAFIPPSLVAERWRNYVPFLIAARWWDEDGPNSKPWRIETFGDPLMTCAPPAEVAKKRIAPPPIAATEGIDLAATLKDTMRRAPDDPTGKDFAQAIGTLDMLGKDEIAAQLWRLADAKGVGAASSRAALNVMFRIRDHQEFLRAWDQLPARDELAVDMLWALYSTRLNPGAPPPDEEALVQLQSAIRPTLPWIDLEQLGPALSKAFGGAHVRDVIQREIDRQHVPSSRQRLEQLMNKY